MNTYILLIVSMLCALFGSVIKKHSTSRFSEKEVMRFIFNAIVSLSCVMSFLIVSAAPEISGFTLALGILFGTVTFVQLVFSLLAYESGPFSYTAVIISLSTVIPALSGYFIWNEKIAPVQIVGMLLMLLCFILSVDFSNKEKKTSKIWFLYVFLAFISTGLIGVMQKWHQSSDYKNELDGFLIIAFLFSFIYSVSGALIVYLLKKKKNTLNSLRQNLSPSFTALIILCGICAAANNKMNLYLSGVIDSAVFFPVVNGGGMILSAIASLIIFKEKFTLQKWLGIAVGIISVILICKPF